MVKTLLYWEFGWLKNIFHCECPPTANWCGNSFIFKEHFQCITLIKILLWCAIVTIQLSSPNMGVILLPFCWLLLWSDMSSDDMTDLLSAHVVFFSSRQLLVGVAGKWVNKRDCTISFYVRMFKEYEFYIWSLS